MGKRGFYDWVAVLTEYFSNILIRFFIKSIASVKNELAL